MKAGIYKDFDGALVYINTAKKITASLPLTPKYVGEVSAHDRERFCLLTTMEGKQVQFDRLADAPPGRCPDPYAVLANYQATVGGVCDRMRDCKPAWTEGVPFGEFDLSRYDKPIGKTTTGRFEKFVSDDPTAPRLKMPGEGESVFHNGGLPGLRPGEEPAILRPGEEVLTAEQHEGLLRKYGYRFCHAQSAAKHRRKGHNVVRLGDGRYAWTRETGTKTVRVLDGGGA